MSNKEITVEREAEALNPDASSEQVDSGNSGSFDPPGPTDIAIRVQALKSAAVNAAAKRDRLPRTLFWSLFHTEIEVIKKRKERRRILQVFSSNT